MAASFCASSPPDAPVAVDDIDADEEGGAASALADGSVGVLDVVLDEPLSWLAGSWPDDVQAASANTATASVVAATPTRLVHRAHDPCLRQTTDSWAARHRRLERVESSSSKSTTDT